MKWLAALLLLAACGGRAAPEAAAPRDEVLERMAESAQGALDNDQPESAQRLYARALTRARERDDPAAIDAMAFGQATAALGHGDNRGALAVSREVREGLARRGRGASAGLLLTEATALFRLGQIAEAERLARAVTTRAEAPEAGRRAWFLLGLIAATRGDVAAVAAARGALGEPEAPAFRADAVELEAVSALLRGDAGFALARAASAAELRQAVVDYRGLSRALALQGAAMARLGDRDRAADLLLRAGRSAAERGETADARLWLAEASRLGRGRPDIQAAIRQVRLQD
jgi:tetratricopeptide (TPR) repeat protein